MVSFINLYLTMLGGRDSSVDISDSLRAGRPGVRDLEWARFSILVRDPPSLLYNVYGVSFPGYSGRGVALTTHPLLATM
jgi:hypothetical protein